MVLLYFPKDFAIKIHDKIIEISGGHRGIKDIGNIDSPLYHIQNDLYYPFLEDKLTHLVFCFNKFHAFNDGNKRTSIALGAFFLQTNGLGNFVNKFIREMENIAVAVADNIIGKELLHEIITSIIYEDDYNEILKLKIFDVLDKADRNTGNDLYENNVMWDLY
ncbi:type II toxin-antitoxin system death-on-curing family toxin [uncultured Chryseobacterium sp.]|jgi:death-on-curing family protein|uniref:type II toxin-antitoxin system death-on-curing family toxin n=1 Tax=uncultured Chryseobacterium sp. TaxID=259322 RepID=UPI002624BA3B|nr:type II toxin-antitoxin system death-on-curing family toxin [uncultured Chryseobacterium sp.]